MKDQLKYYCEIIIEQFGEYAVDVSFGRSADGNMFVKAQQYNKRWISLNEGILKREDVIAVNFSQKNDFATVEIIFKPC